MTFDKFSSVIILDTTSGTNTSEIQLLKTGEFDHPIFGKFKITENDFDNAIEVFESGVQGQELPGNFNHGKLSAGKNPASGWIKKLFKKGKDALFAVVEHTVEAAKDVKDKKFKYISAEFVKNYTDEHGKKHGFAVVGYALTNEPFLSNMNSVVLEKNGTQVIDMAVKFTEQEWDVEKLRFNSVPYKEPGGEVNINAIRAGLVFLEYDNSSTNEVKQATKAELEGLLKKYNDQKMADGYGETYLKLQKIRLKFGAHTYLLSKEEIGMLEQVKKLLGVSSESDIIDTLKKKLEVSGSGNVNTLQTELDKANAKIKELEKKSIGDAGGNIEIQQYKTLLDKANEAIEQHKAQLSAHKQAQEFLTKQLEDIQAERKDNKEKQIKAEIEELKTQGYLNPAMGASLFALFETAGENSFRLSVETIKAGGPQKKHLLENKGSGGDSKAIDDDPVKAFEDEVKRVVKDEKIGYGEAVEKVVAEKPDLYDAYNSAVTTTLR